MTSRQLLYVLLLSTALCAKIRRSASGKGPFNRQSFLVDGSRAPNSPNTISKKNLLQVRKTFGNPSWDADERSLFLEASLGGSEVSFRIDGKEVYKIFNKTIPWAQGQARLHAGIHFLILNERSGKVMRAVNFLTWQPEATRQLQSAIESARDGRIVVILAVPEFTQYLSQEALNLFLELGSHFADRFVVHDTWFMVARKGRGVMHESLSTPTHRNFNSDSSPIKIHISLSLVRGRQCIWYTHVDMEERMKFCENYGGYGNFCRCDTSPWTPDPALGPEYPTKETIALAIVASRRLPHVLRQVGQVWASPGGKRTPIIIVVDGDNEEARALGRILNLTVVEFDNHATVGTPSRINNIVKFALRTAFDRLPEADFAIILEDDLDLAPDFIPFFHQSALALRSDPRLLFANAFNYNSYAHTARDPRKLYRGHGIPGYGWMASRRAAEVMLERWVGEGKGAALWDWWVRRELMGPYDMLLPEVPRTRHMGAGGVHISGFDQILFSSQPMTKESYISLDVESVLLPSYEDRLHKEIEGAKVVLIRSHPCEDLPLPTHKVNRSFVIYIHQPDMSLEHHSYFVIAQCLGINERDLHESYHLLVTFPFHGNQVYVVACPNSPYCHPRHPSVVYHATEEDTKIAQGNPYNVPLLKVSYGVRTQAKDPTEDFERRNRFVVNFTVGGEDE